LMPFGSTKAVYNGAVVLRKKIGFRET